MNLSLFSALTDGISTEGQNKTVFLPWARGLSSWSLYHPVTIQEVSGGFSCYFSYNLVRRCSPQMMAQKNHTWGCKGRGNPAVPGGGGVLRLGHNEPHASGEVNGVAMAWRFPKTYYTLCVDRGMAYKATVLQCGSQ